MEQRISLLTLGVSDLQKSRVFYDALGWKVASEENTGNVIAYNMYGMTLGLFPRDKLAEDAGVPLQPQRYAPIAMAHNVRSEEEVRVVLAKVESAGGTLVKPADKTFWGGYSGYAADPDGFLWEIAYNPFAPLGENGEFQWEGCGS